MLYLNKATHDEILAHAERDAPNEACGMVTAGLRGERVVWLWNRAKDKTKYYDVDPDQFAAVYRDMERDGQLPVAFYHSHPNGKPDPSEADMQGALNVGMFYLIAYLREEPIDSVQIHVVEEPQRPRYRSVWRLSAWECIEMGVLVESDLTVVAS